MDSEVLKNIYVAMTEVNKMAMGARDLAGILCFQESKSLPSHISYNIKNAGYCT